MNQSLCTKNQPKFERITTDWPLARSNFCSTKHHTKLLAGKLLFVHHIIIIMFGDENSPREVLIKNHVEFGGEAGELKTFRWANGDLVFPPGEDRRHANARRQAHLKSKMRGRRWTVPPFDQQMFLLFQPNQTMLSLFSNINSGTSNPAPTATMGRHDDDESAEFSFTNDAATFSTGRKGTSSKKETTKVPIEELTSDLSSMSIGKGVNVDKVKELISAVADFAAGKSAALATFTSENCGGAFVTTQEKIQLEISASQDLIPNMSVSESTRMGDDGVEQLRSLVIKICIRSPDDAKHVSVFYSLYALPGWLSFSPHLTFCPFSTLSPSTKQISLAMGIVVLSTLTLKFPLVTRVI